MTVGNTQTLLHATTPIGATSQPQAMPSDAQCKLANVKPFISPHFDSPFEPQNDIQERKVTKTEDNPLTRNKRRRKSHRQQKEDFIKQQLNIVRQSTNVIAKNSITSIELSLQQKVKKQLKEITDDEVVDVILKSSILVENIPNNIFDFEYESKTDSEIDTSDLRILQHRLKQSNNLLENILYKYGFIFIITKTDEPIQNAIDEKGFCDADIIRIFLEAKETDRLLLEEINIESAHQTMSFNEKLQCKDECKRLKNILLLWKLKYGAEVIQNLTDTNKKIFSVLKDSHFNNIIKFFDTTDHIDKKVVILDMLIALLVNEIFVEVHDDIYNLDSIELFKKLLQPDNKKIIKTFLDEMLKKYRTKIKTNNQARLESNYKLSIILSSMYLIVEDSKKALEIIQKYADHLVNHTNKSHPDAICHNNTEFLNKFMSVTDIIGTYIITISTEEINDLQQNAQLSPEKCNQIEQFIRRIAKFFEAFNKIKNHIEVNKSTNYIKQKFPTKENGKEIELNIIPNEFDCFFSVEPQQMMDYIWAVYDAKDIVDKKITEQPTEKVSLDINIEIPQEFAKRNMFCDAALHISNSKFYSCEDLSKILIRLRNDICRFSPYLCIFRECNVPPVMYSLMGSFQSCKLLERKMENIKVYKEEAFKALMAEEESNKTLALQIKKTQPIKSFATQESEEDIETEIKENDSSINNTIIKKPIEMNCEDILAIDKNNLSADPAVKFQLLKKLYNDGSIDNKINACYTIIDLSFCHLRQIKNKYLTNSDYALITKLEEYIDENQFISKKDKNAFNKFVSIFVQKMPFVYRLNADIIEYFYKLHELAQNHLESISIPEELFSKLLKDVEVIKEIFQEIKSIINTLFNICSTMKLQIKSRRHEADIRREMREFDIRYEYDDTPIHNDEMRRAGDNSNFRDKPQDTPRDTASKKTNNDDRESSSAINMVNISENLKALYLQELPIIDSTYLQKIKTILKSRKN